MALPRAFSVSPVSHPSRLFGRRPDTPSVTYPIQSVTIGWERLQAKRPLLLAAEPTMPRYLIKPEVLELTPDSFIDDGYEVSVLLKTLKQGPGRPTTRALQRSPQRAVPIANHALLELFPMARQTVNRHIHALVARVGGAPLNISAHTPCSDVGDQCSAFGQQYIIVINEND